MSAQLGALVRSYLDEEPVLSPDDPDAEIAGNTRWFSVGAGPVDGQAVGSALRFVADRLRDRYGTTATGPVTFYAWYDEQAGQLRCSVAPRSLPFGGPAVPTDDPQEVIARLRADATPGRVA